MERVSHDGCAVAMREPPDTSNNQHNNDDGDADANEWVFHIG